NSPKWVWVLPTSMVRSTSGLSERPVAGHALAVHVGQGAGERIASRRIQLEQRFEDEAALLDLAVRHVVVRCVDALAFHDEHIDVEWPRRMARRSRIAPELQLDLLCRLQELMRVERGLDLDARVDRKSVV